MSLAAYPEQRILGSCVDANREFGFFYNDIHAKNLFFSTIPLDLVAVVTMADSLRIKLIKPLLKIIDFDHDGIAFRPSGVNSNYIYFSDTQPKKI